MSAGYHDGQNRTKTMSKLSRKEQRLLRHIHAPHGPGSSRATVTTKSDALREALYQDFDERTRQRFRTAFAHYLNEQFDIPMQTAYGKLYQWRIEEWESYGLVGIITQYCSDNNIDTPEWPAHGDNWQQSINDWLSALPSKMRFYHFMRERGMCRTFLRRLLTGQSTITHLQLVGLTTAFNRWRQHKLLHSAVHFVPDTVQNQQSQD